VSSANPNYPNPFVYTQPPLVYPYGSGTNPVPVLNFPMVIGICSPGAIANEPGTPFNNNPFASSIVQDFQTGTYHQIVVPMHWTGTCYTGFASYYYEPTTGAVVNAGGFYGTDGGFIGPIPGRNTLFADIPNVLHLGIGINLTFQRLVSTNPPRFVQTPFPICAVRICEFTERFASVKNSSAVCYPSWESFGRTIHLPPGSTYAGPPTNLPATILPSSGPRPPMQWNKTNFGAYVGGLYADDVFFDKAAYGWQGNWQPGIAGIPLSPEYSPLTEPFDIDLYPTVGILEEYNTVYNQWQYPTGFLQPNVTGQSYYNAPYYYFISPAFVSLPPYLYVPPWTFDDLASGPYPNLYNAELVRQYLDPNGVFLNKIFWQPAPAMTLAMLETAFYNPVLGFSTWRFRNVTPAELNLGATEQLFTGLAGYFVYNTVNMQPANYNLYVYGLSTMPWPAFYVAPPGA
jgi:hypothetical protein